MGDTSVHLSPHGLAALAARVIADRLADPGEWLSWELVPLLDEASYNALIAFIEGRAQDEAELAVEQSGDTILGQVS